MKETVQCDFRKTYTTRTRTAEIYEHHYLHVGQRLASSSIASSSSLGASLPARRARVR
ncbi:hypothetical protein N9H39_03250 [Gammaproteobacteria bacterium]|nr:hypothetical protein [Gammaproteobacteria bacterium]